jgi:hypothetical protein
MFKREKIKEFHSQALSLPPEALLIRRAGDYLSVDAGELARARWFWERRPKRLTPSPQKTLLILTICGGLWMAALCVFPQPEAELMLMGMGMSPIATLPALVYLDSVRLHRWTPDYNRAISRLVRAAKR